MSTDREIILSRVRAALAPLEQRASLPDWDHKLVAQCEAGSDLDLWMLFAERLMGVNGTPLSSAAELVALLEKNNWRHGYCDPALRSRLERTFPGNFTLDTSFMRERLDTYQFGITLADGAIAETGTLILSDRGTSRRLAALTPWVHVAVLRDNRIFRDLPAAIAALGNDPNIIWCTGPSKTADIEGILIEGVHGPGLQIALRMADDPDPWTTSSVDIIRSDPKT